MKSSLFLLLLLLMSAEFLGQTIDNNNSYQLAAYDIIGRPMTSKDMVAEGSPMLNSNWGKGTVKFKSGYWVKDVELQFNLISNELYFRKNNQAYIFTDPLLEFFLAYEEEGQARTAFYRAGYPSVGKNNEGKFYEVLSDGNLVQLLRITSKTLVEKNSYGRGTEKVYRQSFEYYLHDVKEKRIEKVKRDVSSVKTALPGYRERIDEWSREKKLKSIEDLEDLVKFLNRTK
jgi:hypothetical protein